MNLSLLVAQLRTYWRPILVVHQFFTLLGVILLAPLFGLMLQGVLSL